jgi:hypothetical protein
VSSSIETTIMLCFAVLLLQVPKAQCLLAVRTLFQILPQGHCLPRDEQLLTASHTVPNKYGPEEKKRLRQNSFVQYEHMGVTAVIGQGGSWGKTSLNVHVY